MLKGKVALITGGNSGIGFGIAKKFAENGADIAIMSLNIGNRDEVILAIESFGVRCRCYEASVADYEAVTAAVKQITEDFGTLDILVNNAGITKDGLFVRMSESDFDSVIAVNLKGMFNVSRAVSPVMFKKRSGNIISIASVIGIYGNAGQANYAASKAGIIGLTKSLSKEMGIRGIRANAIAPGFIETSMTAVLDEKLKTAMFDSLSIKRMGTPEDVANLALFLAGEQSAYITGQVIQIDGGLRI